MTEVEQSIFDAALSLSPQTRAQLADVLWSSLPEDQLDVPLDNEIRAAWAEEAHRRMRDVEDGKVELLPGDEVIQRLRTKLNK